MTSGNYRELCYGFVNSAVSGSDEIKCSFTKTTYLRCSLMRSGTRKPDRVPIRRFPYFQRPVKNVGKIFLDFFPFLGSIVAAICRRSLASCSNSESNASSHCRRVRSEIFFTITEDVSRFTASPPPK